MTKLAKGNVDFLESYLGDMKKYRMNQSPQMSSDEYDKVFDRFTKYSISATEDWKIANPDEYRELMSN